MRVSPTSCGGRFGATPSDQGREIRDDCVMHVRFVAPSRVFVVSTVCVFDTALLLAGLFLGLGTYRPYSFLGLPLAAFMACITGALVVSHISRNRSGWLLLGMGTSVALNFFLLQLALYVTEQDIGGLDLAQNLIVAGIVAFLGITWTLPLLFLTFPDGRLPSQSWRFVVGVLAIAVILQTIVTVSIARAIVDPIAFIMTLEPARAGGIVIANTTQALLSITDIVLLGVFLASGVSLIVRFRKATSEERQQIKWVVYAGVLALLMFPVGLIRSSSDVMSLAQDVLAAAGALALPLGFGVALMKYRLWDIDVVIRRSVMYGVLWVLITGAYLAVAAGVGLAAGAALPVEIAIALTVLTTLVFLPVRRRVERAADRLVFGRTSSPVEAVQGLGELLGTSDRPAEIAAQLAGTSIEAAGLAHVEVALTGSPPIDVGAPNDQEPTVVPISRAQQTFGEMRCLPHTGRRLSTADVDLLEALASQAGLALAHVRLASRIVHAHEIERRRIERDIHDGAQQELATLVAQLGLARAEINGDASMQRILAEVQREVQRILSNLRELAQGIHPSVLRDGGIAAVLRDRCSRLPIRVSLDVDPQIRHRRFPDDIEDAAYFFLSEALANVLKHSGSESVEVNLRVKEKDLVFEISDAGVGFDPAQRSGSGLTGLSDRIEALGGQFSIANRRGPGMTLTATLPVPDISTEVM